MGTWAEFPGVSADCDICGALKVDEYQQEDLFEMFLIDEMGWFKFEDGDLDLICSACVVAFLKEMGLMEGKNEDEN
jgi:hypothetical protein